MKKGKTEQDILDVIKEVSKERKGTKEYVVHLIGTQEQQLEYLRQLDEVIKRKSIKK